MAVKLGLTLGTGGNKAAVDMDYIREAENLEYDSVWTAEAWGSDALTPAAWVLAQTSKIKVGTGIVQMPARTPSRRGSAHTVSNQGEETVNSPFLRLEVLKCFTSKKIWII